jgi:NAD(P)-dependent dehydrogenase (short-subunit alcohol dehydrogenase family)
MEIDLASLESVRKFASEFKDKFSKLDILINNAGVWNPTDIKRLTKEGFEEQFGINHLGHFLLTNLLIDHLKLGEKSR